MMRATQLVIDLEEVAAKAMFFLKPLALTVENFVISKVTSRNQ